MSFSSTSVKRDALLKKITIAAAISNARITTNLFFSQQFSGTGFGVDTIWPCLGERFITTEARSALLINLTSSSFNQIICLCHQLHTTKSFSTRARGRSVHASLCELPKDS
ncbi:hypothetical protein Mapa_005717 [Marchantia paleacea]|nr:hypothetical protein Mapa_005717 [Marchantia paleacea]